MSGAQEGAVAGVVRIRRRALHGCVVAVMICAALIPTNNTSHAGVVADIIDDANWIMSARLSDGAIANYVDRQAVWPYLANFAAMGLARATAVTKDKRYVEAAWRWASWYQAHMDTQGFVTDYAVKDGKPVSTGFMDSTDAYAGTFLLAVRDTYRVDRNLTRLKSLSKGIAAAVSAIEATQTADGLTWAKPSWKVKYLMDQAETYAGLLAAAELADILKETTLAKRARSDASRMLVGVGRLWNAATQAYDWAVHEDGNRVSTEWTFLYSDALQQPWAVAFGLVPATRATGLVSRFATAQPKWALPDEIALFRGGSREKVGYWPVAGLASYRVGGTEAGPSVASIRSAALAARRAWPFTTGNAGQLILLEAFSLSGAITFDAKSPTLVAATTSTVASPTPAVAPVESTPSPPPAATPSPTPGPTPTPLADVTAQIGPVTGGASAGDAGVDAYATASPASSSPAP